MLYKQLEGGEWLVAEHEVIMPNGTVINEGNQMEGWVWNSEEPEEYAAWKESQNNQIGGPII